MRGTIARLVRNTPFEGLAKAIYYTFRDDPNYRYDQLTIKIMSRTLKRNSNCIDIGCHHGLLLRKMITFAPEGAHMAFEPIPESYEYLLKKFPTVQVFDYALSDTKGKVEFNYVINAPGWSGFKEKHCTGLKSIITKINVDSYSLDDLYPAKRKLDFIKLDVEGAEHLVLKGATNTIAKNKPLVIFEFGLGGADSYGTKPQDFYRFFDQFGMHISVLDTFLDDRRPLSLEQFNKQHYEHLNYYFIAHT